MSIFDFKLLKAWGKISIDCWSRNINSLVLIKLKQIPLNFLFWGCTKLRSVTPKFWKIKKKAQKTSSEYSLNLGTKVTLVQTVICLFVRQ